MNVVDGAVSNREGMSPAVPLERIAVPTRSNEPAMHGVGDR